jgi:hypothetical protein
MLSIWPSRWLERDDITASDPQSLRRACTIGAEAQPAERIDDQPKLARAQVSERRRDSHVRLAMRGNDTEPAGTRETAPFERIEFRREANVAEPINVDNFATYSTGFDVKQRLAPGSELRTVN